jgi:hypothetical protein
MNFEYLGLITLLVGLSILAAPPRWAFVLMVVSTVFGAAAAFSLPALGGASVLVPNLFLVFFVLRIFMAYGEAPMFGAFAPPQAGFWLLLLTVIAVLGAIFLPRIFAGATDTLTAYRPTDGHSAITSSPLRPTTNNITQSVYAIGGTMCFAATYAFLRKAQDAQIVVGALIAAALVNIALAIADLVTYFTGTQYLLDFVHTASYALLTGYEKSGFKRISGSFPEASAFADYTLVLFAAVASLALDRIRTATASLIAIALVLALVFSTSATALVGLAFVLLYLFVRTAAAAANNRASGHPVILTASVAMLPILAVALPIVAPDLVQEVHDFLNDMLFSKAYSHSGRERFMWNERAWLTFLETGGLGAGLGSARASSYALVLLSNVGVAGTVLFCLFVGSVMAARTRVAGADAFDPAIATIRAGKAGVFAALLGSMISGTVYDLGLTIYVLAAAVAALAHSARMSVRLPDYGVARQSFTASRG